MIVYLKTDDAKEPGTVLAFDGRRMVVLWHWARRQFVYSVSELTLS